MAGLLLSDRDAKRLQIMLRQFEHVTNSPKYRRRNKNIVSGGVQIRIFEVQSAATGDGVYNCYQQKLDNTEWNDTAGDDKFDDLNTTSVEVLNLMENDPVASYTPALGKYDRIAAWTMSDDEGNARWGGYPLSPSVRMLKITQDAPAGIVITCNLILNNGEVATSGQLGYNVGVVCMIHPVGTYLNAAVPLLKTDSYLAAQNIQGSWLCTSMFSKMDICA